MASPLLLNHNKPIANTNPPSNSSKITFNPQAIQTPNKNLAPNSSEVTSSDLAPKALDSNDKSSDKPSQQDITHSTSKNKKKLSITQQSTSYPRHLDVMLYLLVSFVTDVHFQCVYQFNLFTRDLTTDDCVHWHEGKGIVDYYYYTQRFAILVHEFAFIFEKERNRLGESVFEKSTLISLLGELRRDPSAPKKGEIYDLHIQCNHILAPELRIAGKSLNRIRHQIELFRRYLQNPVKWGKHKGIMLDQWHMMRQQFDQNLQSLKTQAVNAILRR